MLVGRSVGESRPAEIAYRTLPPPPQVSATRQVYPGCYKCNTTTTMREIRRTVERAAVDPDIRLQKISGISYWGLASPSTRASCGISPQIDGFHWVWASLAAMDVHM